ncbi:MAG TPA: ATP-binding protein [Streptosporangiaceae bacterium]|nr:ATP-binding protein [Streptosporangiaceae bacterium]
MRRCHGPGWRLFYGHPAQAQVARDWVVGLLRRHRCTVDPDDAALVVSELFANAVRHTRSHGGQVLIGYWVWEDGAWIAVCDAGPAARPAPRAPADVTEGGRGLLVVQALSSQVGSFTTTSCHTGAPRHVVWCGLGKPLDVAAADVWAWLACVLPTVTLAARHR